MEEFNNSAGLEHVAVGLEMWLGVTSVLPFWLNQKANNKPLSLTHKEMTRLIFTSTEAARLIYRSIELDDDTNDFYTFKKYEKL